MVNDKAFIANALHAGLDVSYNQGSKFFNSKATRIAYYKFKGEIQ